MKPKRAERKRSTNLELLGGVSLGALRTLRDIAGRADLPLERVFRDVVAIGLSVVSDPEESPYQSLIAFRQGLANKQAELSHANTSSTSAAAETGQDFGGRETKPGSPVFELDSEGSLNPEEQSLGDRPLAALERPGLGAADQADSGSFEPAL